MPTIKITEAFNFHSGGVTRCYDKGEQDVPQAVADHAVARGYSPAPTKAAADAAKAEQSAEASESKAAKKA